MARTRGTARVPASADRGETSLDAAMRAPSTTTPDVVVLDFVDEDVKVKEIADPKKDLWLSTVDGRYSSPIVPIRVGPHAETFHIHRDILTKSEYFRKALNGEFQEAKDQAVYLPEEQPHLFNFVVAFLYEEKYVPIKPSATVLVPEPDKGKGKEISEEPNSGSEDLSDSGGTGSDDSARSRRRRQNRRRRQERAWEQRMRKEPGRHRPDCNCDNCNTGAIGPPCWNCGVPTRRPPPPRPRWYNNVPLPPQPMVPPPRRDRDRRRGPPRPDIVVLEEPVVERMSQEDLRTWCMTYTLSVDVYVCAERYLMQDFKSAIAAWIIDNFEIAGMDAAHPSVLQSCKTLHNGVSLMDPLLKKVFARVGFLQARLWRDFKEETESFFMENPDLAALIMKEMMERREEELKNDLPAMDRPVLFPFPPDPVIIQGPRHPYDRRIYRQRD